MQEISRAMCGAFFKTRQHCKLSNRYWLNAQPPDLQEFKQQVNQVCQLYKEAQKLQAQGVHIVSTDEMTGIQAIERAYPTSAIVVGKS